MSMITVVATIIVALAVAVGVSVASPIQLKYQQQQPHQQQRTMGMIQRAMDMTNRGSRNITSAYEAVKLWDQINNNNYYIDEKPTSLERSTTSKDDANDGPLDDSGSSPMLLWTLPTQIRAICHALHASSLVRIGRDAAAMSAYDQAATLFGQHHQQQLLQQSVSSLLLSDDSPSDSSSSHQQTAALLGKARSLQRLLRYKQAKVQFQTIALSSDVSSPTTTTQSISSSASTATAAAAAVVGAATCALRLGDWDGARSELENYCGWNSISDSAARMHSDTDWFDLETPLGMLGVLQFVQSTKWNQQERMRSWKSRMISTQGAIVSPLWKWLLEIEDCNNGRTDASVWFQKSFFVDYCKVNIGAFDDPLLICLDDKVLLHEFLAQSPAIKTLHFWPEGMIVSKSALLSSSPNETSSSRALWMIKHRAGYGSHGSSLLRVSEERVLAFQQKQSTSKQKQRSDGNDDERVLMQRMVDPPLLINGCKFSIRVYVVLFAQHFVDAAIAPAVYISTEGLVKIASVPLDRNNNPHNDTSIDSRMHVTNSGKEVNMQQESFEYLRQRLSAPSFQHIWNSIVSAVGGVMKLYGDGKSFHGEHMQRDVVANDTYREQIYATRQNLALLGHPKILGFDFVVDGLLNAWLVEINRFPGLEPRSVGGTSSTTSSAIDTLVKHQIVRDAWALAAQRRAKSRRSRWIESNNDTSTVSGSPWLETDFNSWICMDKEKAFLQRVNFTLTN